MTNFESASFVVPEGFAEEQIESQLHYEDLDEDDEIWLIRMPSDIELSVLDRKKIWLSDRLGEVNVGNIKTENDKILECYSESCEISNLSVLLPQRSDNRLRVVNKVIKGTILISEGLTFDGNVQIKSEDTNQCKENTLDSAFESKGKKDKKKKHISHDIDDSVLNYETEGTKYKTSSTIPDKHGKKHSDVQRRHNSGRIDVKKEPFSMDWDGFPPCVSQG